MRIYCAHPVRGMTGTPEEIAKNTLESKRWGEELRYRFPEVDWYVPGEHDVFPQMALAGGELSIDQVLDIDKAILYNCQGVVVLEWTGSAGVREETKFARKNNIPVYYIDPNIDDWSDLRAWLDRCLEKFVENKK
jgi:hypothetical protein